jgi:hypothetical protein
MSALGPARHHETTPQASGTAAGTTENRGSLTSAFAVLVPVMRRAAIGPPEVTGSMTVSNAVVGPREG